jgi:hypothetical protein
LYDRAMTGKSRKAAMRMFCLECMGYSERGVEECTTTVCPLYPYRTAPRSRAIVHPPIQVGVQVANRGSGLATEDAAPNGRE